MKNHFYGSRSALFISKGNQMSKQDLPGKGYSEFETRKKLIDKSLERLGWVKSVDWFEEVELLGMPNASGVGYADYVLFGDDGLPLAVIEAKKSTSNVEVGRQQAKLYADLLEKNTQNAP